MLFNSFEFLVFFPVVTIVYFLIPHQWRWLHLLIASCIFYMAFIPVYILILIFTIVIDYFAGIIIEKSVGRKRKLFLIISIIANVGILAVFKYYNFFIENVNELFHLTGQKAGFSYLNIILPIGLSFHTFQAMSYTIEVYRGNQAAEKHFGIYALYVLFYPQLVAGPIERPQNLLHQFREKHPFEINRMYEGLRLMLWGLFKKVVIADRLSIYVDAVYGNPEQHSGMNLLVATIFFAIQIYCDFSGYSDMAIGAAKVMGFKLMTNFNRPYFARNIQEFWKRWHISLSSWFRDYVYISLGGNRVSKSRVYLNVIIVFLLSGFWHGANWTFVIWGGIHALLIVSYMLFRQYVKQNIAKKNWLADAAATLFTFSVVCLAWIFFRAGSTAEAIYILSAIFSGNNNAFQFIVSSKGMEFGITSALISVAMIGLLLWNDRFQDVLQTALNNKRHRDILVNGMMLFLIIVFGVFQKTSFIYFQF
jgi:alginate O-acetyltransferase complex protein AlgI